MKKSTIMACFLAAAGVVAIVILPRKPAFAGDQLTVASYGGPYQLAQRKAYFEPYAKQAGVKITEDEYDGTRAKIRAMVESKTVSWDVINVDVSSAIALCDEGIIEPIDWTKLGLEQAKFMGSDRTECGVPNDLYAQVVVYDKAKLPNGPKTIADFFDLQRFPGKRGLYKNPYGNLEWALIADGVPISDVYKVLRTSEGVDRAFKKLDTIKKDAVWFVSFAQPQQLLADGQVIMTMSGNGRVDETNKSSGKHFEIMWDAQELGMNVWALPKGSPRREDAYKFIAFISSAQAQANRSQYIAYGPANKDANALVDPAILANLPTTTEHLRNALQIDTTFWSDKRDELVERFTAWLAK
ncbi:putative spermidine/putrescine transport system substrate-binding protein [Bradyrhizobium japonicum]